MFDYNELFKVLPVWANVIMDCPVNEDPLATGGDMVIVLETDEKGQGGHVCKYNIQSGTKEPTQWMSEEHIWYDPANQARVLARKPSPTSRVPEKPEGRVVTQEEWEILSDMGMLDYLRLEDLVLPSSELDDEPLLYVNVSLQSGASTFEHNDGDDPRHQIHTVDQFIDVMGKAYKALHFANELEIFIHGGFQGPTRRYIGFNE